MSEEIIDEEAQVAEETAEIIEDVAAEEPPAPPEPPEAEEPDAIEAEEPPSPPEPPEPPTAEEDIEAEEPDAIEAEEPPEPPEPPAPPEPPDEGDEGEERESGEIVFDEKPYLERVQSGELKPPPFKKLSEEGELVDFSLDEVISSEDFSIEEKTGYLDNQITTLKNTLSETDYVIIKIAEGVSTKDDYQDILEQRAQARTQINELENYISQLQGD